MHCNSGLKVRGSESFRRSWLGLVDRKTTFRLTLPEKNSTKKNPDDALHVGIKKWRRLTLPPSKGQYHQRKRA